VKLVAPFGYFEGIDVHYTLLFLCRGVLQTL